MPSASLKNTHISDTKKVGYSSFQANTEYFQKKKIDDHWNPNVMICAGQNLK